MKAPVPLIARYLRTVLRETFNSAAIARVPRSWGFDNTPESVQNYRRDM